VRRKHHEVESFLDGARGCMSWCVFPFLICVKEGHTVIDCFPNVIVYIDFFCSSLRLSIDSFLFIVAPAPRHVKMCCKSSSVCSQNQHCIILPWLRMCLVFVHQKLKIIFVSVGCLAVGVLCNAILKDFHAISPPYYGSTFLFLLCVLPVWDGGSCAQHFE
jgi:hypothetical protein